MGSAAAFSEACPMVLHHDFEPGGFFQVRAPCMGLAVDQDVRVAYERWSPVSCTAAGQCGVGAAAGVFSVFGRDFLEDLHVLRLESVDDACVVLNGVASPLG